MQYFTSEFFRGNRQRLRTYMTGTAPIILAGNGLMQRNADTSYPFRQDSSFWYLTGINEPDFILVMDKTKEYLIAPIREGSRAVFDGSIDDEAVARQSGIESILSEKEGWKQLSARLKRVKHVATLAPAAPYIEQHGLYTNPARAQLTERIKAITPDIELLNLRSHLIRMRSIKQSEELAAIQAAIDLTSTSLKEIYKKRASYTHEYEVEADITGMFRRVNSDHAYQPIIASGQHACTLHYVANDGVIDPKGLLLLDVGAEVEHYAADITRTFAIGTTSKRQRSILDAVLEVQEHAKARLKPGVLMKNYEKDVEHFMGEKLRELGLIKNIDHDSVRRYYPHATSHFLGLDVHDLGDYERPLEAGMVLTVEPGIYIPEEGIGVRVEDNVVITADGIKNLSQDLPGTW